MRQITSGTVRLVQQRVVYIAEHEGCSGVSINVKHLEGESVSGIASLKHSNVVS
jgi:hypothetical protein